MSNLEEGIKKSDSTIKVIISITIAFIIFIISPIPSDLLFQLIFLKIDFFNQAINNILKGIIDIALFIFLLRLYITKILKKDLTCFEIIKPKISVFWFVIALIIPVSVICFYIFTVDGQFEYADPKKFPIYIGLIFKSGFVAGITEEFLFRGFIMKSVEDRWNKKVAVVAPSILFALIHIFKGMGSIDTILVITAGTIVGIMFSLVTYSSKSIWNSIIIHIVWNILILRVVAIVAPASSYRSGLINYNIDSQSYLLTGGEFGIQAGLPAIVAYLVVIFITLFIINKSNRVEK